jgi:inward rectifier potassium channel
MSNGPGGPVVKEDNDTGLSTKVQSRNQRSIRPDGSFNIENRGARWLQPGDIYLALITMPWLKFNIIVFGTYLFINTIFALIYFAIGTEYLTNIEGITNWGKFLDTFFFSAQSLTTVGYGRVAPVGIPVSSVAAIESMVGLLGFALATGLLYGRFSKANAKIIHSRNMVIGPYQGGTGLMFRIANMRLTQLVEVEVQVTLAMITNEEGREVRRFFPLDLERNKIAMFPLSWTVVHPINENSLLFRKTKEELLREDVELMVYFKAYDETFSQNVHYRISYRAGDMVWGAKFIINFEAQADGPTIHYLNRIGDYEFVDLPAVVEAEPSQEHSVRQKL